MGNIEVYDCRAVEELSIAPKSIFLDVVVVWKTIFNYGGIPHTKPAILWLLHQQCARNLSDAISPCVFAACPFVVDWLQRSKWI